MEVPALFVGIGCDVCILQRPSCQDYHTVCISLSVLYGRMNLLMPSHCKSSVSSMAATMLETAVSKWSKIKNDKFELSVSLLDFFEL